MPLDECPNRYLILQEVTVKLVRLCWYAHHHTKFSQHAWWLSFLAKSKSRSTSSLKLVHTGQSNSVISPNFGYLPLVIQTNRVSSDIPRIFTLLLAPCRRNSAWTNSSTILPTPPFVFALPLKHFGIKRVRHYIFDWPTLPRQSHAYVLHQQGAANGQVLLFRLVLSPHSNFLGCLNLPSGICSLSIHPAIFSSLTYLLNWAIADTR